MFVCPLAFSCRHSKTEMFMSGLPTATADSKVVSAEFMREVERLAKHAGDAGGQATKPEQAGKNTAHEHMVVFLTCVGSDRVSIPVARYFHDTLDAGDVAELVDEVLVATASYGLKVVAMSCDGATENRAAAVLLCDRRADEFIPASVTSLHPDIDFGFVLGQDHPSIKDAVVIWVFDMPHAVSVPARQ